MMAMKTLLLLRHAKSSWKDAGQDDFDRPLNGRGQREAPLVGEYLKAEQLLPELIAASSARRTRETAELVIQASGYRSDVRFSRDLYEADVASLRAFVETLPEECSRVLLIGHNPGLEEFLADISGESATLKTSALVELHLPGNSWRDLGRKPAKLVRLWRPAE
jgi:phosphohistidine phosphatase